MSIQVAILEDHSILAKELCANVRQDPGVSITGIYFNSESLIRDVGSATPDVLILDVQIRSINGPQLIGSLAEHYPKMRLLVCTNMDDPSYVSALFKAGVAGYVLKTNRSQLLISAIHAVYNGYHFIDPEITPVVRNKKKSRKQASLLTEQELKILKLVTRGLSSKDIAQQLLLSKRIIDNCRKSIGTKLEAKGKNDLIKKAGALGLIV